METEVEVKTILVDYVCDDCGKQVKYIDGNMILTDPPKFKHNCIECGKEYVFNHKYPTIKYEYS